MGKNSNFSDTATSRDSLALYELAEENSSLQEVEDQSLALSKLINKNKTPDLNYIKSAVIEIKKNLKVGQTIISECTTYPGNTEEFLIPLFKNKGFKGKFIIPLPKPYILR